MDHKLVIIADHVIDSEINLSWIVFFSVCTDSRKLDSFKFILFFELFIFLEFLFVAFFTDFIAKFTETFLLCDNLSFPNELIKAFHATMKMIQS
jgi:hypothetical protein